MHFLGGQIDRFRFACRRAFSRECFLQRRKHGDIFFSEVLALDEPREEHAQRGTLLSNGLSEHLREARRRVPSDVDRGDVSETITEKVEPELSVALPHFSGFAVRMRRLELSEPLGNKGVERLILFRCPPNASNVVARDYVSVDLCGFFLSSSRISFARRELETMPGVRETDVGGRGIAGPPETEYSYYSDSTLDAAEDNCAGLDGTFNAAP